MKLISILFSLFFASTIVVNSNAVNTMDDRGITKQVVYDGYDGRIFYFTDIKDNTIIIEDINASKTLNNYNLEANKHVGKAFNLTVKQSTEDNIYSEIEVVSINLINQ
ncbi:hypothetical protein [Olleya sp. AS48]|jgi:hypothetical protein|uniref:hypothetical protein n=1 Tax=Olleya sp. AS48 TaxID=3135774 RepID=UPI0030D905C2